MKKFTQDKFNEDHLEPRDYGEGDYYVVSHQYSDTQAAALISQWESDLTGETHTYTADDIGIVDLVVGKNEDGEADWCIDMGASKREAVAQGKAVSS